MKISRIICLVLAFILSVSVVTMTSFAENTSKVSNIELLNELGIVKGYEDGELHPEYNITRMEYAALIIRCLGYEGEYPSLDTVFTDVPKESWGAAAVQFAYDLGIINGYGDGRFGPDDNIKEIDAIKIIVCALGRGLEAEAGGGYPTGYLSVAQKYGIMDELTGVNENASRGYVASLLANALDIPIVEQNFTSNAFMENKGRTFLSILNISRYEGMLTAVSGSNLESEENVLKDEIIISGRKFKTNKTFLSKFLGEQVTAYVYKYGQSEEKVVAMFISKEANKTLKVSSKDIMPATNLSKFVYIDKNKEKEIDLPAGLSIIYNGTLLNKSVDITPDKLKPENGSVKLIDINRDNKYEIILVEEFKTYVVKTKTEDTIYDIYGNSITFDNDEENSSISITKSGKIVSWEDINPGNVLSVASNMDYNVAQIIISDEISTENVISNATRDGKIYYGFKTGNELCTTAEYNAALSKGYREALKIELGNRYKFRLNSFGEIAFVEEYVSESEGEGKTEDDVMDVKGKENYGFLCNALLSSKEMSEKLELKILTTNNRLEIFTITSENGVRFGRMVDGVYRISKVSPSEVYALLVSSDGIIRRQIVKYVLAEDGIINEFYLADAKSGSANLSQDTIRNSHTFAYNTIDQTMYYNEDTVLFMLNGNGDHDYDIICTTPGGYLSSRSTYNSELWDIESDGYVNCICLYPSDGNSSSRNQKVFVLDVLNDAVMFVTYVGEEINDDGMVYKIIEGYEDGKKVRRVLSDTLSQTAAVRPGMIIQYQTNKADLKFAYYSEDDEVVIGFVEMFDCSESHDKPTIFYDHKTAAKSNARLIYGYTTITRLDFPTIAINLKNIKATLHAGTMVLKYNSKTGAVEKVDVNQVMEGQKVFFRKRLDNLRDIVIID